MKTIHECLECAREEITHDTSTPEGWFTLYGNFKFGGLKSAEFCSMRCLRARVNDEAGIASRHDLERVR